jgi:ABC-type Mn2+/Zn2+ transport system permease subunit
MVAEHVEAWLLSMSKHASGLFFSFTLFAPTAPLAIPKSSCYLYIRSFYLKKKYFQLITDSQCFDSKFVEVG